jgi:hypothetical protein
MNNIVPIPYTFFEDVEKPSKFIILGDTDSMFINLPNIKVDDVNNAVQKCENIAKEINNNLTNLLNSFLLPKMGINTKYNKTDFKTEIIANGIVLLDVKKNYGYRQVAKEGKITDPPIMKYTGINVKSDLPKWTKDFLSELIENILLNQNIPSNQTTNAINNLIEKMKQKIIDDIENYDFTYIGTPKKWSKSEEAVQIIPMKLYNTLVQDKIMSLFSSCLMVPITINNPAQFESLISKYRNVGDNLFIENTPISNLSYIAVPHKYNFNKLKTIFNEFGIIVEFNKVWDIVCNSTIHKVINIQKGYL